MKIDLEINGIKPVLLNNSHKITTINRRPGKYKTPGTKVFESYCYQKLVAQFKKVNEFNSAYDKSKHYLTIDMKFYVPLLTKKNLISEKSGDWDGYPKIVQDCIFKQLKADDSQIINGNVTKIHSLDYSIKISVRIHDLADILL